MSQAMVEALTNSSLPTIAVGSKDTFFNYHNPTPESLLPDSYRINMITYKYKCLNCKDKTDFTKKNKCTTTQEQLKRINDKT